MRKSRRKIQKIANESDGAHEWLKHIEEGSCYIILENGTCTVKNPNGHSAEPSELPARLFEYFKKQGYIEHEGPAGKPPRAFFLTQIGRDATK